MADKDLNKEFSGALNSRAPTRVLSPAARRALAEAELRRAKAASDVRQPVKELGGRKGPEPTRFGDWERRGITHDF